MQGKFIIKTLTAAVISCTSLVSQASISGNSHDGIVAVVNDEIILKVSSIKPLSWSQLKSKKRRQCHSRSSTNAGFR